MTQTQQQIVIGVLAIFVAINSALDVWHAHISRERAAILSQRIDLLYETLAHQDSVNQKLMRLHESTVNDINGVYEILKSELK